MRFVLVNGRTPRPLSLCVECAQPIGESYLREFGSRQVYCDYNCYATVHSKPTTALIRTRARAYRTVPPNESRQAESLCPR